MQVKIGDLTKQKVSGIVNPTNNQLNLTGGVSKHIATAVGPELKVACKEYLEALPAGHRQVPVGTAVVSPIHELLSSPMPFENIIHAVGPHYSGEHLSLFPVSERERRVVLKEHFGLSFYLIYF